MKRSLVVFFLILSTQLVQAQEQRHTVSAGVGFPNLPRLFFNYLGTEKGFSSTGTGPYHLKYEYRAKPWYGIGLSINNMSFTVNYTNNHIDTFSGRLVPNKVKISGNNTSFNIRNNFHLINPENNEKFDLYVGLGIGYRAGKINVESEYEGAAGDIDLPNVFKFGFEISVGLRYFLDENIGFYTELGAAKSVIQGGMSLRF